MTAQEHDVNYMVGDSPGNGSLEEFGVRYLRVSSASQMDTARDIDPDGNSIATQREVCIRKERALGITVVREFVEPGNSGQSIEKRPVFREMITYLAEHPNIKSVLIYMRSRAFRNYVDAGVTERQFKSKGIKLISAKEDFGEGIWADAMKGMADIMNEVQVRMSGEDIKIKMQHKAMNGGTIGRAKIGYLNIRADFDGRLVNTIGVDPERAPLVRLAFELYATGEWTIFDLCKYMGDLGLRTRPTSRWPAKALSHSKLSDMLRDPYYTGVMVYKDQIIPEGRHEAIISHELFEKVQQVLDSRKQVGSRMRIHNHYLRGDLYCERCHGNGRTSRLLFTQGKSHTGAVYSYFKCRGRQEGVCDLPHVPVWQVEELVVDSYRTLPLDPGFADTVREQIEGALTEAERLAAESHRNLTKELGALAKREQRLLDLVEDGTLDTATARVRLRRLQLERARITEALNETSESLEAGARAVLKAIDMLENAHSTYRDASDHTRSILNKAFNKHFFVDELPDAPGGISLRRVLGEPFAELHEAQGSYLEQERVMGKRAPDQRAHDLSQTMPRPADSNSSTAFTVEGWSKQVMVGLTGFEPATL